jgi:hypothetical protein
MSFIFKEGWLLLLRSVLTHKDTLFPLTLCVYGFRVIIKLSIGRGGPSSRTAQSM